MTITMAAPMSCARRLRAAHTAVPGLFLAGEILDVDGITGGFNFQAAWSTGYIAGVKAALVGKALYDGKMTLQNALEAAAG